jgi:hypothetical protein
MAQEIVFSIGGKEFAALPAKIDRKKLYGWSEIHAFDDDGNECTLVSTDSSGTIVIPKGGVGLGILSDDGKWIERSRLKTVTADGSDAELIPSSYGRVNAPVKASEEDLLDCSITAFYHMEADEDFVKAVGGDIYKFDYCYRDAYESSPAFLLTSEIDSKKGLFMFIGKENAFEFLGLTEISVAEDTEAEDEEEGDDMDFSMF